MVRSQLPESIDASVLIAIENADALLMMAPQIADLNPQSDVKPVKLELEAIASFAEEVYAAMSPNALAIAMGSGAEPKSVDMLVAESLDPPSFISGNMDYER